MTDDFQRYLRAKRTVDDRALDRRLLERLREALQENQTTGEPLRVLEVGAGIGTMAIRLLEWDILPTGVIHYTAVDVQPENVTALDTHIREWAADRSVTVSEPDSDFIRIDGPERRVEIHSVAEEAVSYVDGANSGWDFLIGAALLDILSEDAIDRLLEVVAPDGLAYFPIVFDGVTRFRPSHPADPTIERHYHEHMDAKPGGNSQAGTDVVDRLHRRDDVSVLGVGGSDWIVRPHDGEYPADEAAFLRHILGTIEEAVDENHEGALPELDAWIEQRRNQLDAGKLLYFTHQLDVLCRIDASPTASEH